MTSFNMVSWADVEKAFENENAIFLINGEDLRDSAQAAIDSGETFHVEDLGLGDRDLSLKREYEKLLGGGMVYEFMPVYDMDEDANADGAELRMFIHVPDNHDGYRLTGNEKVIFLYVNESENKITFRSNIDGYLTQKVSVKAFSQNTAVIPGDGANGGSGVNPDGAIPGESGANQEETTAVDETAGNGTEVNQGETLNNGTEANQGETSNNGTEVNQGETSNNESEVNSGETADDETETNPGGTAGHETQGNSDKTGGNEKLTDPAGTAAGDEAPASSGGSSADNGAAKAPDAGKAVNNSSQDKKNNNSQPDHEDAASKDQASADVQASISRHVLSVLSSSESSAFKEEAGDEKKDFSYTESTASEADKAVNGGTSGGKAYGAVLLDESYYAKAYVASLNQLHVDVSAEGYGVTYAVEPVGTAYAQGPEAVAEAGTLSFTVTPQIGYEISAVTVNGETATADEVESTDASDHGKRRYTITGVTEEQEVAITTAATGDHPEFKFEKVINGVTVNLHAEQGILPAGTEARITEVTDKVAEAVKEKSAEEAAAESTVNDVLAYDIKLYYNDEELDNSWSDQGYVNVTFSGAPIKERSLAADRVEIIHMSTDVDVAAKTVEKISAEEVTGLEAVAEPITVDGGKQVGEVSFEAEHFSVYTITFSGKAVLKVHVMDIKTGNEIGTTDGSLTQDGGNGQEYSASQLASLILNKMGEDVKTQYSFSKATRANGKELDSFYYSSGKLHATKIFNLYFNQITGDVYFWYHSFNVTFDSNGGNGGPKNVAVNGTFVLPDPSTLGISKNGRTFVGWSTDKTGRGSVFVSGIENTVTKDTTYYAIWIDKNGEDNTNVAYFYIRIDGEIQYEPAGYSNNYYYPLGSAKTLQGKLRTPAAVNNNLDNVASNLQVIPTDEAIKAVLNKGGVSYDPNTQHILWYVIKYRDKDNNKTYWNVDGVVRDNEKYELIYHPNGGNTSVPGSNEYKAGYNVKIQYDPAPSKAGYEFLGWDEDKEAGTPTYKVGSNTSLTMPDHDVTLYAVWRPSEATGFKVNHWLQRSNTAGDKSDDFDLTDESPEIKYKATESKVYDKDYAKTISDYMYEEGIIDNQTEAIVNGNGTTELNLYYLKKFTIKITGESKTKTYDGKPLSGGYQIEGALRAGDKEEVVVSGAITDAGEAANKIVSYKIKDSNNVDVTDKYVISTVDGTLKVNRAAAKITAKSETKKYGEPNPELAYTPADFLNGDTPKTLGITVNLKTEANEASKKGTYAITFDSPVTQTGNYNIVYENGTLTIVQNETNIIITAESHRKPYDGTALTASGVESVSGLVGEDHVDEVKMTDDSTITNAGKKENKIKSFVIRNKNGEIVTDQYSNISTVPGTLTVTQVDATVTANDIWKQYGKDMPNLTYTAAGFVNNESPESLSLDLKLQTDAGKTSGAGTFDITFADKKKAHNYNITYVNGKLHVTPNLDHIIIKASDAIKVYDGKELTKASYTMTGRLADGDRIKEVIMKADSRITNAGTKENGIDHVVIVNENGDNVTSCYENLRLADGQLIVIKAPAFVMAKPAYKAYGDVNPKLDYEVSGFVNGETPSGLGIEPKLKTNADEKSQAGFYAITFEEPVTSTANYSLIYIPGVLVVKRNASDIVITAKSGTQVYNGTALTESGYEISGQLASGDYVSSVEMTKESVITDAGTRKNEIKSVVIRNASGKDVTKNYSSLKTAAGTLTVSKAQATVKAEDKAKNYGEEIPVLKYTVKGLENGETFEGLHVPVELYTDATKTSPAGDYVISFKNKVEETKNYKITYENGSLRVGKNGEVLVIRALDADKAYDGTELTRAEYSITGNLEDGDYIDKVVMTADSRITDAGTQRNKIDYVVIRNGAGVNVTESYAGLRIEEGILTVNKAQVTVTAVNKTKGYGEKVPDLEYQVKGLKNGETFEDIGVKVTLSTDVTKTSPAGAYGIIFKDPEKETKNYRISYEDGALTVEKNGAAIVIRALDADKVYDGKELARAEYGMAGSLRDGDHIHKVVMTEDSRITNAGTQKNRIAYVLVKNAADLDVTDSYAGLVTEDGTLTVHKANMIVTAADKSKIQGSSNPGLTYSIQGLVNGETPEGLGLKPQLRTDAAGNSAAGKYAITFVDPVSTIANYNISYAEGVLTVERRNTGGSSGGSGGSTGGGSGSSPDFSRPYTPGGPGDNMVTVEPEPVPLADLPNGGNAADNFLIIDDGSIPLAGLPKTGDKGPIQGFAAIVSGILLAVYAAVSRMRKEEN
ncbi:MAG: doubled motif LPXTG anchor domain-containing protein [Hungatella sp.]|nr:doubled motif LPXTG anchor domain-containing protein [Hungatella sp.]